MAIATNLGASIAICATATTSDTDTLAEFQALVYVNVGKTTTIPQFGDTYQDVTFVPLDTGRTEHYKGTVDGGTTTIECGSDSSDAGQDALRTALGVRNGLYAIRMQAADGSTGSPSAPTTWYFLAKIMSGAVTIGAANQIVVESFMIGINSDIIRADAV